jgi:hypothetical protein
MPLRDKEKEGSSSFLKKRTKKLLCVTDITKLAHLNLPLPGMSKSSWLLLFKKEVFLP